MQKNKQDISDKESTLQKIERMHPYAMVLYLSIIGSTLIFFGMIVAFLMATYGGNRPPMESIAMPKSFYLSTVLLLASSWILERAVKAFKVDDFVSLRRSLVILMGISLAFAGLQSVGWLELYVASKTIETSSLAIASLYIVSVLHWLHILAGVIYTSYYLSQVSSMYKDPVKILITVTNPYEALKLRMLRTYWHFVDALWLVLFLIFMIVL
ncbi:MAG: cytochrome C oxidase subunit III [Bernardetiaceae bacterium]|nr:cytochrome C oxidase subunit III [Bernardetiaceae bacterium]